MTRASRNPAADRTTCVAKRTLLLPYLPVLGLPLLGILGFCMLVLLGCGTAASIADRAATGGWFTAASPVASIGFQHRSGPPGRYFYPRTIGSGAALLDYNNDGRLDLFLTTNAGPDADSYNGLYEQQSDGTFVDVAQQAGLRLAGYFQAIGAADVNHDGWIDLCLAGLNETSVYINREGRFERLPDDHGVINPNWGTGVAFADLNRDGLLDLVVANYVEYATDRECTSLAGGKDFCGPHHFPATASRVFRNLGLDAQGLRRFLDETLASGLATHPGKALGVFCADFDGDHWIDLLLANDSQPNTLFINQRDGTFEEQGLRRGVAVNAMGMSEANMGIGVGDIDNDGLFDLYVTHLLNERHRLWKQGPQGLFHDRTTSLGLGGSASLGTGFGTVLADFDNDADVDLAIAHGGVLKPVGKQTPDSADDFWAPYAQRNALLANEGGTFRDASAGNPSFCDTPGVYRSLACGDINNDGFPDLVVCQVDGPVRVLLNQAPRGNHWVRFRLRDAERNRDDLHGVIRIVGQPSGRAQTRWAHPCASYAVSNDPRIHFGLAADTALRDIIVTWTDGTAERFVVDAVDVERTLVKGTGQATDNSTQSADPPGSPAP
jgi:hypothetical protein